MIDQEQEVVAKNQVKTHHLVEVMKGLDHKKLEPKLLPDSDIILPPDESQLPPGKSPSKSNPVSSIDENAKVGTPKKQTASPVLEDTLELSQSIIMTDSQISKIQNAGTQQQTISSPAPAGKKPGQQEQNGPMVFSDPRVQEAMMRKGSANQGLEEHSKKDQQESKDVEIHLTSEDFRKKETIR
jgi:hypothetical protein